MEELQQRIRAIRVHQADANLAKQPYGALPDSGNALDRTDANVVEMPSRHPPQEGITEDLTMQRSVAKAKAQTKRKPKAPSTASKGSGSLGSVSFRQQLRDVKQQSFAEELKRLEAQAERINQLLAERASQTAQRSQRAAEDPSSATPFTPPSFSPHTVKGDRQVARDAHPVHPPDPASEHPISALENESTDSLKQQAVRIKQILAELEFNLTESEATAISDSTKASVQAIRPDSIQEKHRSKAAAHGMSPIQPASSYLPHSSLPHRTQIAPDHDSQQADQEAAATAQALRYLAHRERAPSAIAENMLENYGDRTHPRPSRQSAGLLKRSGLRLRQLLQIPQKPMDRLGDATLWIVLAIATRIGLRLLTGILPAFTPLVFLLMFVPAALAIYLAGFVPKAGAVSSYRLFLITLGLLIGGKF